MESGCISGRHYGQRHGELSPSNSRPQRNADSDWSNAESIHRRGINRGQRWPSDRAHVRADVYSADLYFLYPRSFLSRVASPRGPFAGHRISEKG